MALAFTEIQEDFKIDTKVRFNKYRSPFSVIMPVPDPLHYH